MSEKEFNLSHKARRANKTGGLWYKEEDIKEFVERLRRITSHVCSEKNCSWNHSLGYVREEIDQLVGDKLK